MSKYDEKMLDDDHLVHFGYWYVLDGEPMQSPLSGKVVDLKEYYCVSEVTSCDIFGRGIEETYNAGL